jgi:hypothetical protein
MGYAPAQVTPEAPIQETIYSGPAPEPRPPRIPEPVADDVEQVERELNAFIVHVFGWIAGALLLSAFFASYSDRWIGGALFLITTRALFMLVSAMLVLAFFISRKVCDMVPEVAAAMLVAYAALQGFIFGLAYRGAYSASLAPVYLIMAAVFGLLCAYGKWTGSDLTSLKDEFIGADIAFILAIASAYLFQLQITAACAACAGSWLMLSLAGYHRDLLRDLPSSFEDDPKSRKAAAVGALQVYLDLVTILVIVIQLRWLQSFLSDDDERYAKKFIS